MATLCWALGIETQSWPSCGMEVNVKQIWITQVASLFTLPYFAAAQHTFLLSSKCSVSSVPNTLVASTDADQDFVHESVPHRISCINLTVKPCTKPQKKITHLSKILQSLLWNVWSPSYVFSMSPCPVLTLLTCVSFLLPPHTHPGLSFSCLCPHTHHPDERSFTLSLSLTSATRVHHGYLGVGGSCLWEQKLICYN